MMVAAGGSAARTPQAADTEGLVKAEWTPLGLRNDTTTVMVQVAGDPSALVEGNANRELSDAEKASIEAKLKVTQAGVEKAVEQLGGTVVADYQAAYNGLKVRINRNKTDEVAQVANVVAVRPLAVVQPDNVRGVSLIGAPAVWDGVNGLHGEKIKIAVIDTGIDYTHANFGGPGTIAAYNAANATDTLPANAALFGPAAPRVKGGIDLVGDDYNADRTDPAYQPVPHPDPNPLDCNGHGSHVAGTAAGSGVLANGTHLHGPVQRDDDLGQLVDDRSGRRSEGRHLRHSRLRLRRLDRRHGRRDRVGCRPRHGRHQHVARLLVRHRRRPVGSCLDERREGRRHRRHLGRQQRPEPVHHGLARHRRRRALDRGQRLVTELPGRRDHAVERCDDGRDERERLRRSPGRSRARSRSSPTTRRRLPRRVPRLRRLRLRTRSGQDRGREPRHVRPRRARVFGQQAGAHRRDHGQQRHDPARRSRARSPATRTRASRLRRHDPVPRGQGPPDDAHVRRRQAPRVERGERRAIVAKLLANTNFKGFADFSSGGPRTGDSGLKPDITAPGVSIVSTGNGTGNGAATISGTSMASPHAAGVAALTKQAHPRKSSKRCRWKVREWKAAIINTADPAGVLGYRTSRGGSGLVQPALSTKTQAGRVPQQGPGRLAQLRLRRAQGGLLEDADDEGREPRRRTRGRSTSPRRCRAGLLTRSAFDEPSFVVAGASDHFVDVTLNVPAATAGVSNGAGLSFNEVAGLIEVTPATARSSTAASRPASRTTSSRVPSRTSRRSWGAS